jgi:hypothetical protein
MPSSPQSPLSPQRATRIHNGLLGSVKQLWTRSKMNWIGSLLLGMALVSCGWNDSHKGSSASALFDPDHVTLKPSVQYYFVEGTLEGRGQKLHSQYSYERAVIIGNKNHNW